MTGRRIHLEVKHDREEEDSTDNKQSGQR